MSIEMIGSIAGILVVIVFIKVAFHLFTSAVETKQIHMH